MKNQQKKNNQATSVPVRRSTRLNSSSTGDGNPEEIAKADHPGKIRSWDDLKVVDGGKNVDPLFTIMEDDGEGSDFWIKSDHVSGGLEEKFMSHLNDFLSFEELRMHARTLKEKVTAFCPMNTVASIPSISTGPLSNSGSANKTNVTTTKSVSGSAEVSASFKTEERIPVMKDIESDASNGCYGFTTGSQNRNSVSMGVQESNTKTNDAGGSNFYDRLIADEFPPESMNSPAGEGGSYHPPGGQKQSHVIRDSSSLMPLIENISIGLNFENSKNREPVTLGVTSECMHAGNGSANSPRVQLENPASVGPHGSDLGLAKDSNLFSTGPTHMHKLVDQALVSIGLAQSAAHHDIEKGTQECTSQGCNMLQIGNVSVPLNNASDSTFVYEHDKFTTLEHHDIEYEKLMGTKIWNADLFNKLIQGLDVEDSETRLLYDPPPLDHDGNKVVKLNSHFMAKCNRAYALHLFGYLVGASLSFFKVKQCAIRMWHRFGLSEVYRNNAGVFFFKFSNENGMQQVLQQGAWLFEDVPMVLDLWQPDSCLDKPDPAMVPIWISIIDLPLSLWNGGNISQIVSGIGRPIMLDKPTYERCKTKEGVVGYARVLVHALAQNGLPDSVKAQFPSTKNGEGKTCSFKLGYNWKPPVCSKCNVFGHDDGNCPLLPKPKETIPSVVNDATNPIVVDSQQGKGGDEDDGFVEVKKKTRNKNPKPKSKQNQPKTVTFKPVFKAKAQSSNAGPSQTIGVDRPSVEKVRPNDNGKQPIVLSNSFAAFNSDDKDDTDDNWNDDTGLWDSEKTLALNLVKEKTVPTSTVFSKWSSKLKEYFVSLCIDHELPYQHLLGAEVDVLSEEDGTARFMANDCIS
ncbi:hypothetical protein SSX86_018022 [Deinandra increscens subsp. villosa]|uniref:DUF4283 domain-containing protein n=1 Tax=Deinandra increscens subsp. villosa TaxID=3103831 RepID=A0AAP0CVA4_9ASTR